MEKEVRDGIIASVALIVGIMSIFVFREIIEGLILIIFSGLVAWFSPNLKEVILSFFKLIFSKFYSKNARNMQDVSGLIQSERDTIVNNIIREGDTVIYNKSEDRKIRNKLIMDESLRIIYKKMTVALREVNRIGNVGVKDKEEYERIYKNVEEFISAKMEHEIDIEGDIKSKFDEVMGAFRFTMGELGILASEKKFHEGVKGLKAFDFIQKCNEATAMIKQKLNDD